MSEPFRTSRRVEFAETDLAGIAHFSNFFRWMESAEVDFLIARGLNVSLGWNGQKLGFPRVSASCDHHAASDVHGSRRHYRQRGARRHKIRNLHFRV